MTKEIYQQFGSHCPFCDESDVAALQIHHITPHAHVKEHQAENLILVCANCHQKIEDGKISIQEILAAKAQRQIFTHPNRGQLTSSNKQSVTVHGGNQGFVANVITLQTKRTTVKTSPPSGSIGSDLEKHNYVKYLIDRYHEYKRVDAGQKMKYFLLPKAIEREFGAAWKHISTQKFDRLVEYLQRRIDGTILGKARKSAGQRRYSSFEEHQMK